MASKTLNLVCSWNSLEKENFAPDELIEVTFEETKDFGSYELVKYLEEVKSNYLDYGKGDSVDDFDSEDDFNDYCDYVESCQSGGFNLQNVLDIAIEEYGNPHGISYKVKSFKFIDFDNDWTE